MNKRKKWWIIGSIAAVVLIGMGIMLALGGPAKTMAKIVKAPDCDYMMDALFDDGIARHEDIPTVNLNHWKAKIQGDLDRYYLTDFYFSAHRTPFGSNVSYQYAYKLRTTEDTYIISFQLSGATRSEIQMRSFELQPKSLVVDQGLKWIGRDILQIPVLIWGILGSAFILFTIVHCVRKRPKLWVLWIIGMLFQSGVYRMDYRFNMSMGIFYARAGLSRYAIDDMGNYELIIAVPVIAIIYWIVVKRRKAKQQHDAYVAEREAAHLAEQVAKQAEDQDVAPSNHAAETPPKVEER